jgi:2-oxoglutarate dehydrogenase E2 component (dihydrolipoamide succinyltransferase)
MPKMGESVNEGTIVKWYKQIGDSVAQDEIIFEISTDKVDTDIPSPASGVLKEIKYRKGDTVEVGTIVAVIESYGEEVKKEKSHEGTETEEQFDISQSDFAETSNGLTQIEMPKMGESVMEGTIIKWYKKVGEKVAQDETLFEISTDKVDTEVPSPVEGTVAEILIGEQETVEVGTIVAKISSGVLPRTTKKQRSTATAIKITEPTAMHDNFSQPSVGTRTREKETGSAFYSPLVLNISQKEDISFDELKNITGTGLSGRVTKKDILSYIEQKGTAKIKLPESAPSPSFVPPDRSSIEFAGGVEKIPMDNIRQKIMEHMVVSRDTSVHVSSMIEVDMTKVHNFIQQNKDEYNQKQNIKLTYLAFIAEACVRALKEYPLVNSTLEGNTILQKNFVNLGIAVAIEPTGLIVPNIKNAEQLNLLGLANAVNELAFKARNKKLLADDVSGGTFSITNYGVFGTVFGTPSINQPEVAILGVGAVIKKPVVIQVDGTDAISIRPTMALTLSHDHRLVDGMLGGMFLKSIKDTLENFDPGKI